MVSDQDLLLSIKLELVVHRLRIQLLDLVLVEDTSSDLLEVPSDEEIAGRGDDGRLLTVGAEVVELRRLEVNGTDPVLSHISSAQLQLEWVGLLLSHAVLEPSLTVAAHRGNAQ